MYLENSFPVITMNFAKVLIHFRGDEKKAAVADQLFKINIFFKQWQHENQLLVRKISMRRPSFPLPF